MRGAAFYRYTHNVERGVSALRNEIQADIGVSALLMQFKSGEYLLKSEHKVMIR